MRYILLGVLWAGLAFGQYSGLNTWSLGAASSYPSGGYTVTAGTGMTIKATNQKVAFKFYASSTAALTGADVSLKPTGTITGITLKFDIETDSADAPSGTILGAATSAFAGPSSAGFTGYQTFGSNTGTLTLNSPYWLVITDGGGTAPTGSNYFQLQYSTLQESGGRLRAYNGTNWTTVAAIVGSAIAALGDGTHYYGTPTSAAGGNSANKIFGANREGVQFKVGAGATLVGFKMKIAVTSPTNSLDVCLMTGGAGGTVIDKVVIPGANVVTQSIVTFFFPTAQSLTAGVTYYLIGHQDANGGGNVCQDAGSGSSSNYYVFWTNAWNTTYLEDGTPTNYRTVAGTATDPASLTASSNSLMLVPVFADPYTSLSSGSSSITVAY